MNTINFLYFAYNYNMQQLEQTLEQTGLKQHFLDKFYKLATKHNNGTFALIDLLMEMSDDNKQIVLDWIEGNYKAFK